MCTSLCSHTYSSEPLQTVWSCNFIYISARAYVNAWLDTVVAKRIYRMNVCIRCDVTIFVLGSHMLTGSASSECNTRTMYTYMYAKSNKCSCSCNGTVCMCEVYVMDRTQVLYVCMDTTAHYYDCVSTICMYDYDCTLKQKNNLLKSKLWSCSMYGMAWAAANKFLLAVSRQMLQTRYDIMCGGVKSIQAFWYEYPNKIPIDFF